MVHTKKLTLPSPIVGPPPLIRSFSAPAKLLKEPDFDPRGQPSGPASTVTARATDTEQSAVRAQQIAQGKAADRHYAALIEKKTFELVPTPASGDCYLWSVAASALSKKSPPELLARLAGPLGDAAKIAEIVRDTGSAAHARFERDVVGGLRSALVEHMKAHVEDYVPDIFGSPHWKRLPDELAARVRAVEDWSDFDDPKLGALYTELSASKQTPRFKGETPIAISEGDLAILVDRPGSLDAVGAMRRAKPALDAYFALLSDPGEMISLVESRALSHLLGKQIVELDESAKKTKVRSCVGPDTSDADPIVLYANAVHASVALER